MVQCSISSKLDTDTHTHLPPPSLHSPSWRSMTHHSWRVTLSIIIFEVVMRHVFWSVTTLFHVIKNLGFSSPNCVYSYKNRIFCWFLVFRINFRAEVVCIDGLVFTSNSGFQIATSGKGCRVTQNSASCVMHDAPKRRVMFRDAWYGFSTHPLPRTTHHGIYGCSHHTWNQKISFFPRRKYKYSFFFSLSMSLTAGSLE